MASCARCGAPVRWVQDGAGEPVALDAHEVMRGEHRFAERDGRLVPVTAQAEVLAFAEHRWTCPNPRRERR